MEISRLCSKSRRGANQPGRPTAHKLPQAPADCECGCPGRTFVSAWWSGICRKKWPRWFDWIAKMHSWLDCLFERLQGRRSPFFPIVAIAPVPVVFQARRGSWKIEPPIWRLLLLLVQASANHVQRVPRLRPREKRIGNGLRRACLPAPRCSDRVAPPLLCSEALYSSTIRWTRLLRIAAGALQILMRIGKFIFDQFLATLGQVQLLGEIFFLIFLCVPRGVS